MLLSAKIERTLAKNLEHASTNNQVRRHPHRRVIDEKPYEVIGLFLKYSAVFSLLDMTLQNAIRITQEGRSV
jgi:hypothetical protein